MSGIGLETSVMYIYSCKFPPFPPLLFLISFLPFPNSPFLFPFLLLLPASPSCFSFLPPPSLLPYSLPPFPSPSSPSPELTKLKL